jgi:hypothetical protein
MPLTSSTEPFNRAAKSQANTLNSWSSCLPGHTSFSTIAKSRKWIAPSELLTLDLDSFKVAASIQGWIHERNSDKDVPCGRSPSRNKNLASIGLQSRGGLMPLNNDQLETALVDLSRVFGEYVATSTRVMQHLEARIRELELEIGAIRFSKALDELDRY